MNRIVITASIFIFFLKAAAQNVGIGTLTPQFKLSVHDDSHGYIKFSNNTTTQSNTSGSFIGAYENDLYFWNRQPTGNMFFYTDGSRRLTLDSVGRLGIGKWPAEAMDVKGSVRIESPSATAGAAIKMYGGTTNLSYIQFYKNITTPTAMGYIGFHPTQDYAVIQSGIAVSVNSTGMGVGTVSPETRLHVPFGTDAGLPGTNNGFLMLGQGTSSNIVLDNNEIMARNNGAASGLYLQNDAGNIYMCGDGLGAVGIGVNTGNIPAGYMLAVDGKIISEELKVQLSGNWPDYVFADHYHLKPLKEVEKYIATHKHLPNIPSASEVEKNGIEIGDMQKRLMEKIEELTLYILDLQKQIDDLNKTNKNT